MLTANTAADTFMEIVDRLMDGNLKAHVKSC